MVCLSTGTVLHEAGDLAALFLLSGHEGRDQCQVFMGQSLNKCTVEGDL